MMATPEDTIKMAPPGAMIYARFKVEGETGWQTGLLVREDTFHLERIVRNPLVEIRAGVFVEDKVVLLVVMIQVAGQIYETWFNYYQQGMETKEYLRDWMRQDRMLVSFYGLHGRERSIRVRNSLGDIAQKALDVLSQTEPWGMEEFDAARERLYKRYPTMERLWARLG